VVQFSAKARDLNFWLENSDETLNDPINCSVVEDAERLVAEYQKWEQEQTEKAKEHAELKSLAEQMKALNITDFSGVTIEELNEKWTSIGTVGKERKQALQKELEVQRHNDSLSKNFAEKAKAFSQWVHGQKEKLAATKGALEQQLEELQVLHTAYEAKRKDYNDIEAINKQVEAAGVKRNRYTDLTLRTLYSEYEQLGSATAKQETLLTNEIMAKKNADVSPEQLNEFKEVFKHFDKNHDGTLGRVEFKACLQALGDEPTESELDKIMSSVDPENKGIGLQAFSNFMIQRNKDSDSKDEILIAFKELANDKDFVSEQDLRKVMTNERVAFLLERMPKYHNGEGYDYKAWVEIAYK